MKEICQVKNALTFQFISKTLLCVITEIAI